MAQKRKTEITAVDENGREFTSLFRTTANDLSKFYALAKQQQSLAFDAGQKDALEKLNEWITLKLQEGKLVTVAAISAYLQNELNNSAHISHLQEPWGGPSQNNQMQNQEIKINASASQDLEMEMNSEDPIQ